MPRTEPSCFIGIDPGKSGGICILVNDEEPMLHPMPGTVKAYLELIQSNTEGAVCYIEKLWGYVGGRNSAPAMFKLGQSYGSLVMGLVAVGIPYSEVVPRTWQAGLGITPKTKTEGTTQFKNRLKQEAEKLLPKSRITLATADAVLIAIYCQRAWGKVR